RAVAVHGLEDEARWEAARQTPAASHPVELGYRTAVCYCEHAHCKLVGPTAQGDRPAIGEAPASQDLRKAHSGVDLPQVKAQFTARTAAQFVSVRGEEGGQVRMHVPIRIHC